MNNLEKAIEMCDSSIGYKVQKTYTGEYALYFYYNGKVDTGARGTSGTGLKLYQTEQKAKEAGERYIKRMKSEGFQVERY